MRGGIGIQRRRLARGVIAGLLGAATWATFAATAPTGAAGDSETSPSGTATTRCKVEDGVLTVRPGKEDFVLVRDGERIAVVDLGGGEACAGPQPTVTSIDAIEVPWIGVGGRLIFDLRHGLLEPGASAESDGSSEIELNIGGMGAFSSLEVRLGAGGQHVRMGALTGGRTGLNLNADVEGDADVEITLARGRSAFPLADLAVYAGPGPDRVSATGGPEFVAPFGTGPTAKGRVPFLSLFGGPGRDILHGSPGPDFVDPGRGPDTVKTGRGRDSVTARHEGRDLVDCGPGRDLAEVGPEDRVRRCRLVRFAQGSEHDATDAR